MCSCYSEQSTRFKLSLIVFIVMSITAGATFLILGIFPHNQKIKITELGFALYLTGIILGYVVCCPSCKSSQTDENASSTPAPPPPINTGHLSNFSRTHQLRQNRNAKLSRQQRNFGKIGKGNNGEVILSCTDWETFAKDTKATKTSDKEESCVICFEPLTSRGRLVPCGHASFCFNCGQKISQQDGSRCPLCRTEINQVNFETAISIGIDSIHRKNESGTSSF